MRISCVGGGPAGLFLAIAVKLLDPRHELTVHERNPAGSTSGWGVTYTDDLLDRLHRHDPVLGTRVRQHSVVWRGLRTHLHGGRSAGSSGYGFAIARTTLSQLLTQRAADLEVQVRHGSRVSDPGSCVGADLVVAADGAHSRIRDARPELFGTVRELGANYFIWLATDRVFVELTFVLQRTSAGLIWLHAYPYSAGMSTCVVECSSSTAHALGFIPGAGSGADRLSEIFADVLRGHRLRDGSGGVTAGWQRFEHVRNDHWFAGNVVLVGDAAHTTHFSLGAGTHEAITDAGTLARALYRYPELSDALTSYQRRRKPRMDELQADARHSMATFERIEEFAHLDPVTFGAVLAGENDVLGPASLHDRLCATGPVRGLQRVLDVAALRARAARRARGNRR